MKALAILVLITTSLISCGPNLDTPYNANPSFNSDTIPTIVMEEDSVEAMEPEASRTYSGIELNVGTDEVSLNSPAYNINYPTDAHRIVLEISDAGNITFFKVDNTILFNETKKINHNYTYLDANCIEIQNGNVLEAIVKDHRALGYDISISSLKQCNTYLNKRNLQSGDIVCISCNKLRK